MNVFFPVWTLSMGFQLCSLGVKPLRCHEDNLSLVNHLPLVPLPPACLGSTMRLL